MAQTSGILIRAASDQEIAIVQSLWREYWASFRFSPCFQNFEEELRSLPDAYDGPRGRLLVGYVCGDPAGTAALRPINERSCEAKRFYVRPKYRGKRIGRSLLERLVEEARAAGYRNMYGDTLESMTQALDLYKRFGFLETPPYAADPTPGAIYLKLSLVEDCPAAAATDW
jgi:GNAT superfamily N-acetyltransferase